MALSDTRMIARALVQRWPIKPEYRAGLITKLMQVIASPNSSPREVTAAAKAILAAEAQNQADEHKVIDIDLQQSHDRLAAIAAELGIDAGIVIDAQRIAGGDAEGIGGEGGGN